MQQGEASTEEILGIIKRVIERENREVAADEKRKRASTGFSAAIRPASVVALVEPEREPEPAPEGEAPEEVLDLGDADLLLEESQDEDVAPAEEAAPDSLTSETARRSVNDSFAALAMLARGNDSAADAEVDSPLEGMVREMLRPMLAEWLDENLPTIVEKLVREEIDRIAGKSR